VVSCKISQPPAPPKKAKKSSVPSSSDPVLEVILHDTVLFPEGGGQPSDIGHIATSNGQTYEVMQVKRAGGHAVHYVCSKNVDTDVLALSFGTEITVNLGQDGFNRRYDHVSDHLTTRRLAVQTSYSRADDNAYLSTPAFCAT
jgi:misacylated tRNA(Ala) deacylase